MDHLTPKDIHLDEQSATSNMVTERPWITPDIILISADAINGGTFNINETSFPLPGVHGTIS